MTPEQAARLLADTMNQIEAAGYILYPHPRPVGISLRVAREKGQKCVHPEQTMAVARIWDQGDGAGWKPQAPG